MEDGSWVLVFLGGGSHPASTWKRGCASGAVDRRQDLRTPIQIHGHHLKPWMSIPIHGCHPNLWPPMWSCRHPSGSMDTHLDLWIPIKDMDTHLNPWMPIWIHKHPFGFSGHPMPIQIHDQPNPSPWCSEESHLFPTHGGVLLPI